MPDEKSLTHKISESLGPLAELEQEVRRIHDTFARDLTALCRRVDAAARAALQGSILTSAAQAAAEAVASTETRHQHMLSGLTAAARRILVAHTQAEILSALTDGAEHFSGRAVLFISRGEHLVAWETRGVESRDTSSGIRATQIPKKSETILAAACHEMKVVVGNISSHRQNIHLAERLGKETPGEIICLPIVFRERVTAVLYADAVPSRPRALAPDALALLVELSQTQIELRALESKLGLKPRPVPATAQAAAPPLPVPPPPAPALVQAEAPVTPIIESVPPRLEPAIEPVPIPLAPPAPVAEAVPAVETEAPAVTAPSSSVVAFPVTTAHPRDRSKIPVTGDVPQEQAPSVEVKLPVEAEETTRMEIEDIPLFGTSREPEIEVPTPTAPLGGAMDAGAAQDLYARVSAEATVALPSEGTAAAGEEEAIEIDLDTIFSEPEVKEEEPELLGMDFRIRVEEPETPVSAIPLPGPPRDPEASRFGVTGDVPQAAFEPAVISPSPLTDRQDTLRFTAPPAPAPAETAAAISTPSPDTERMHSDAKRFARLLVSEIKLYNEQVVIEGRKHRDIYDRLKKDIDRSRELYEKRVSEVVSRRVDYFHDELVRILGANDPTTLGSDYPGPRTAAGG